MFDWLSFTNKGFDTKKTVELLGLDNVPWQNVKGFNGYQDRLYYESISIHYNGRENGIWCEMSGKGCRAFNDFGTGDYFNLLKTLMSCDFTNITRIDIAFDDKENLLDMKRLYTDTIEKNYVSRFARCKVEYDTNQRTGIDGITVYHGRKGSDVMIRIYDKAAEQNLKDGTHWIRVEVQLRNDRAREFVKLYLEKGEKVIGSVFQGVVNNYLRYIVPEDSDSNKWRWQMTDYWERFIKTSEKVTLFKKPNIEYTYERLNHHVINRQGNSIEAMIAIHGLEHFNHLIDSRNIRENPKYKEIVKRHKRKPKKKPPPDLNQENDQLDLSGLPMGMTLDLTTGEIIDGVDLPFK